MTTITIDRELLEQALEALNKVQWPSRQTTDAIEAIRARLAHTEGKSATAPAQPERKPMTAKRIDAAIETAPEPSTEVAVGKLCKSLREDLDYAWTWHCNIAMAAFDAGCPHDVANEGAARFMQLLAGVDTREHPAFQGTQDHPMRNDKTVPKPSAH